jgi:transglutaminase-like putative cysteine protease
MYIDSNHPTVQKIAVQIRESADTEEEIIKAIFFYVRDRILFGFHPEVDRLSASEIIERGSGQCNNKSIVFMALCQALDIPARLVFSDIDRSIHRGFIPGWAYRLFPETISHSWVEVRVQEQWHRIDGYINDNTLFHAGRAALLEAGWSCGFSVADPAQASSDFSLTAENFVQMGAVTKTHGYYSNPADYFDSPLYQNKPRGLRKLIAGYVLRTMDQRVQALRTNYQKQLQPVSTERHQLST